MGTGALQEEVDERLKAIEAHEAELAELRERGREINEDQELHVGREMRLEEQALHKRSEAALLEGLIGTEASEHEALAGQIQHAEAGQEAVVQQIAATEAMLKGEWERQAEEARVCEALRSAVQEEYAECGAGPDGDCKEQRAEIAVLTGLKEQAQAAKRRNQQLKEEQSKLQENAKQVQKALDRHLADIGEATRRATRLKQSHSELQEIFPSTGPRFREQLVSAVDRAMDRVNKKTDALVSYLEGKEAGPRRSPRVGGDERLNGEAALQRRLLTATQQAMEAALTDERKKVIAEQHRILDDAAKRSQELEAARAERRRLAEDHTAVRKDYEMVRQQVKSECEGLHEQVESVDREPALGADVVTAEFSDLLQKQALERDVLQRQTDELRAEIEIRENCGDEDEVDNHEAGEKPSPAELLQRIAEAEAEADALRQEEENLRHALVGRKATHVAARALTDASPSPAWPSVGSLTPEHEAGSLKSTVVPVRRTVTPDYLGRRDENNATPKPRARKITGGRESCRELADDAGTTAADRCTADAASPSSEVSGQQWTSPPSASTGECHQRTDCTPGARTPGSGGALPVPRPVISQLGDSMRSVSTHSLSTSGSSPTVQHGKSAGASGSVPSNSGLASTPTMHTRKTTASAPTSPVGACRGVAASASAPALQPGALMTSFIAMAPSPHSLPCQIRGGGAYAPALAHGYANVSSTWPAPHGRRHPTPTVLR